VSWMHTSAAVSTTPSSCSCLSRRSLMGSADSWPEVQGNGQAREDHD
jgi:hypothetical protein